MTRTALFVQSLSGWRGDAALYRLSEPLEGYTHVIVSAASVALALGIETETYIFGARHDGRSWAVDDWCELDGSLKGTLVHADALAAAGYEVVGADADE